MILTRRCATTVAARDSRAGLSEYRQGTPDQREDGWLSRASQQRKRVEDEEDRHGADEQEDEEGRAHFSPVYPAVVLGGRAASLRAPHLPGRRVDVEGLVLVPVGGAAATEMPLVVALADELLALWTDRQRIVVDGRRPLRLSNPPPPKQSHRESGGVRRW